MEYTDGDREDLNESEVGYAMELAYQIELDEEGELKMVREKDKHLDVWCSFYCVLVSFYVAPP